MGQRELNIDENINKDTKYQVFWAVRSIRYKMGDRRQTLFVLKKSACPLKSMAREVMLM